MADNTDVYAFVSPDAPDTVTLISNFFPFQKPDGGPNFYSFDPMIVGDLPAARLMLQTQLAKTATPDLAMAVGQLAEAIGEPYFKHGQLPDAQRASTQALRTGIRNAGILCHAAEIAAADRRHGDGGHATSPRAPGATRRCLEWHP